MRRMKPEEISKLIEEFGWATLCMVDPGGRPYAIEFSYFLNDADICGLVHPRGMTAACLSAEPRVCVKLCDSDSRCRDYRAASCFGTAAFEWISDPERIAWAWDSLERQLGASDGRFEAYKQRHIASGRGLPLLRIRVEERTGVTSMPADREQGRKW